MALDEVTEIFIISDLKNLIAEKHGIPAHDQFLFHGSTNDEMKTRTTALFDDCLLRDYWENPVFELYFLTGTSRMNLPLTLVDPDINDGRPDPPRLPFHNLFIVDELTGTIYRDDDMPLVKMLTHDREKSYTTTASVFKCLCQEGVLFADRDAIRVYENKTHYVIRLSADCVNQEKELQSNIRANEKIIPTLSEYKQSLPIPYATQQSSLLSITEMSKIFEVPSKYTEFCRRNRLACSDIASLRPVVERIPGSIPRVVPLGIQSSGKSAVLQRLCLWDLFPITELRTTLMEINYKFRYADTCKPVILETWSKSVGPLNRKTFVLPYGNYNADLEHLMEIEVDISNMEDVVFDITIAGPYPDLDITDVPGFNSSSKEILHKRKAIMERNLVGENTIPLWIAEVGSRNHFIGADESDYIYEILNNVSSTTNPGIKDSTIGVITKIDRTTDEEKRSDLEAFLLNTDSTREFESIGFTLPEEEPKENTMPDPNATRRYALKNRWVAVANPDFRFEEDFLEDMIGVIREVADVYYQMLRDFEAKGIDSSSDLSRGRSAVESCCLTLQAVAQEEFCTAVYPNLKDKNVIGGNSLIYRLSALYYGKILSSYIIPAYESIGRDMEELDRQDKELGIPCAHLPLSQADYNQLVDKIVAVVNNKVDSIYSTFNESVHDLTVSVDKAISAILAEKSQMIQELLTIRKVVEEISKLANEKAAILIDQSLKDLIVRLFENDDSEVKMGRFPIIAEALIELFLNECRSSISSALESLQAFLSDLKEKESTTDYFVFNRTLYGVTMNDGPPPPCSFLYDTDHRKTYDSRVSLRLDADFSSNGESSPSSSSSSLSKIATMINGIFLKKFDVTNISGSVKEVVNTALPRHTIETCYKERQTIRTALAYARRARVELQSASDKARDNAKASFQSNEGAGGHQGKEK